jgi:hypothetical protein
MEMKTVTPEGSGNRVRRHFAAVGTLRIQRTSWELCAIGGSVSRHSAFQANSGFAEGWKWRDGILFCQSKGFPVLRMTPQALERSQR